MRTGRPKTLLVLTDEERAQLQSLARSRSLSAALTARARIVLSCADGEANAVWLAPVAPSGPWPDDLDADLTESRIGPKAVDEQLLHATLQRTFFLAVVPHRVDLSF